VISPARELFAQGLSAALDRLATWQPRPAGAQGNLAPASLQARTRQEIAACRQQLLVDQGGSRLRRPGLETLSAAPARGWPPCCPAVPGSGDGKELALRLADFVLRALGLFCGATT
jgi:hypothetical protein